MSQLIERLREAHDNFAGLEGVSNDDLVAVLDAATALIQPPSPVAAGGYVLVPVEPTEAMIAAAMDLDLTAMPDDVTVVRTAVYRAMLTAAPPIGETVPGAGWQPIETAPKDGTVVDLWCVHPTLSPMRSADMTWFKDAWLTDTYGDGLNPDWQPTHWMVPAPPLASTQEGEAP